MKRLNALIKKEFLQIMRDPSALLIALILPLILLFIFGYGVNLDSNRLKIGLVLEDNTPDITSLSTAFTNSHFLDIKIGKDRREFEKELAATRLRGIVIIPQNFSADTALSAQSAKIQVITDASEPNTASFVQSYVHGVVQVWLVHQVEDQEHNITDRIINVEQRYWYNPELKSRHFLLPGSIAIIMTLIGTLLTALVIAREWERGTMEAMMATPVSIVQILLGKLIPYFILGIGSMLICWLVATIFYQIPFRGSLPALLATTSIFLLGALGQGLFISSASKDQFVASQAAIVSAYLPAFMLSGFFFEISSMPWPIQILTHVFAARYYVTCLQTLFLTGNIWPLLLSSMSCMAIISILFFVLTAKKSKKRLDI